MGVMGVFRKFLFVLAHEIGDPSFYATFRKVQKNQLRPYAELKLEQEKQLRALIRYAYDQVPYYHDLFKQLDLQPKSIRTIEDLEQLPILTKDIIRANWEAFMPANLSSLKYDSRATGGSTGTPMQYRVSRHDQYLAAAVLYRGWGYGGYDLGDRMVFLAGSSLDVGTKPWLIKRSHEITRNVRKLSSFDMADAEMRRYADILNSFHPRFMRGYASSIYFFARWLEQNDVAVPTLHAIFTTAERLYPNMRKRIGEVFRCEVYDTYGLNDGGVTAFECVEHSGLHIDTDRSIMEIVDPDHQQIAQGQGEILATSLHNFAMPFIRYSTGDQATVTDDNCGCGRHTKLLEGVVGRSVDIFVTPEGKNVHGWFFLLIFWEHGHGIKEYQLIQTALDKITIKIVPDENFDPNKIETIKKIISSKSPGWDIRIEEVEAIDRTRAGKFKFIINEMILDGPI